MIKFLQEIKRKGIQLSVSGDNSLSIQAPKGAMTKSLMNKIKENKNEIIELLEIKSSNSTQVIPKAPVKEYYSLSYAQERLWLANEIAGDSLYNMSIDILVEGSLDESILEKSFKKIIQRHEVLRTNFIFKEGEPRQFISADAEYFDLNIVDFSAFKDKKRKFEDYLQKEKNYVFDIKKDRLFRFSLVKTSKDVYNIIVVIHHLIFDGLSASLFTSELFNLYRYGKECNLPSIKIQYKDYAEWENNQIGKELYEKNFTFWKNKFDDEIPRINFPTSSNIHTSNGSNGSLETISLNNITVNRLETLCQKRGATLFIGLTTILKVLIYRYTNQKDLIVGAPASGRDNYNLRHQLGLFVNMLALRTKIDPNQSFLDNLMSVRETVIEGFAHQSFPFHHLINSLSLPPSLKNDNFFEIIVSMEEKSTSSFLDNQELGIGITFQEDEDIKPKYGLEFLFRKGRDSTILELTYKNEIFSKTFITQILDHFANLLEEVANVPSKKLIEYRMLSSIQEDEILNVFGKNLKELPANTYFLDHYNKCVELFFKRPGITQNETIISYETLDKKASQLAHYIKSEKKIGVRDRIAVQLERSSDLLITFLAIMKLNCTYVPIDKSLPESRKKYILRDAECRLKIDEHFLENYGEIKHSTLLSDENPIFQDDIAYIIYTSGSTGKPKGVKITQGNLINFALWHIENFEVSEYSKSILFASIGFDASIMEFVPYLMAGGQIHILPNNETRLSIGLLKEFLTKNEISHCFLPPQICSEFAYKENGCKSLKILTGGDVLKLLSSSNLQIYNNYGPTENTVVATSYKIGKAELGKLPIGSPIFNTNLYVLSPEMNVQPIGVEGELFISGKSLSSGYIQRPLENEKKFISDPFTKDSIIYRTGDIVRWLPNGNLEFIGRNDSQIKIRGYRIELEEIETAIFNYSEDIIQVIVDAQNKNNRKFLCAFYIAKNDVDEDGVKKHLSNVLPNYMQPDFYLKVDNFPLNRNGKLDRKKLPRIDNITQINNEFHYPTNEFELELVKLWEDVLQIKAVSITDNFFELGGNSIQLIRLINRINSRYNLMLPSTIIFELPTIKQLSRFYSYLTVEPCPENDIDSIGIKI